MRKYLLLIPALLALTGPARSADSTVSSMGAAAALDGTELYYGVQGGADKKVTGSQIKTYVGGGTVTSLTATCGVTASPSTITNTGSFSANVTATNNTGTTDTITNAQCGTVRTQSNASSSAIAITTAGFVSGNYFTVKNLGAGVATYTPSSGTIGGAATLVCQQNQSSDVYFDGTNFITLSNSCTANTGTITVASGTSALGTGAISSATCATVVTTAATNTATTDVVGWGFNGDPTAVTGYAPVTTGALTIFAYPSSGNVNFKVCNLTTASVTPGAITLNWRIVR